MSVVHAMKLTRRVCEKSPPAPMVKKHRVKGKTALSTFLHRGAGLFSPAGTRVDLSFDGDPAFLAGEDLEPDYVGAIKSATIVT